MTIRPIVGAVSIAVLATPTLAAAPIALHPERIGAETARFDHGRAIVRLKTPTGIVEIRPMPVEKGRLSFAVAVINRGDGPANFGIENISATLNGLPIAVPDHAQLAAKAQEKARARQIGVGLLAGALAGIASTASNQGTYYRHVHGPRGGYTRAIHWENNTPGVIGATAAVAGGAMAIRGIDRKLDYTLDRLGAQVLQTTTVDPGSSFGGLVIVPVDRRAAMPAQIVLHVSFNGIAYPFAFRMAPPGAALPPPLPATPADR
jgi:hypothetical protein